MTVAELEESARHGGEPPEGLSPALRALWLAKAGRWDDSHDLCQDVPDPGGAWIHAYLHREEGDLGNAGYWYSRAGKRAPGRETSLADEWREITAAFL